LDGGLILEDMTLMDVLEMFGIAPDEVGAVLWLELVGELRQRPDAPVSEIMWEMCRKYKSSLKYLYIQMKRDIAPLLNADEGLLGALGFYPKRRTTTEFARLAATSYRR